MVVEEDCVSGLTPRRRLLDGLGVGSGKAGEGEADRARRLPDARELEREKAKRDGVFQVSQFSSG